MALIRLETATTSYENGREFGGVGAYERIRGRAHFALDPAAPANQLITDLSLAPRQSDGRVHFSADVSILKPVDPDRGSRRLLLDVVNRGNPVAVRMMDDDYYPPGTDAGAGCGWLFERGYTLVCCGWQHDVPENQGLFSIDAPEAMVNGQSLTGRMMSVQQPAANTQELYLSDGTGITKHVAYPAANVDERNAVLLERDYPFGPPSTIPREEWRFARLDRGQPVPDPTYAYHEPGFKAGKTYQVIYTAKGAVITGAGLAATRDFVSYLRFASRADGNPCAGLLDYALAFGASQTGRFLRQMLYLDLCHDESGRLVFDGLLPHIGGGKLIEANWRFGQPSYNGQDSTSSLFPFTDEDQTESVAGRTDGILRRSRMTGSLPKVVYTNSSCEYWGSQAALTHTHLNGQEDAVLPDNVRIYHFAGTQHVPAPLPLAQPPGPHGQNFPNSLDYKPLLRAALVNLDAWATEGTAPPASRYPNLNNGTLVSRESVRPYFDMLPGAGVPSHLPPFAQLNFGPGAIEKHHATLLPPEVLEKLPELVAAIDEDGNELGGLRHPELDVPLASYTGWNPRLLSSGETAPMMLVGSILPFAAIAPNREMSGDPRPSIAERYPSREAFLAEVRKAANALVLNRYLLARDLQYVVEYAGKRYDLLAGQQ